MQNIEFIWGVNIISVFVLCVLFTGLLIPQIIKISYTRQLFDEVDERKIHHGTVPRLGGIAFLPSIISAFALVDGIESLLGNSLIAETIFFNSTTIAFCCAAGFGIYVIGVADDLVNVRYRAKFVGQALCAILLMCGGLTITNFHGFLDCYYIPLYIAAPFTLLVVIFIMNAINLIDGIDGLASGLSGIAMIIYGCVLYRYDDYIFSILAFATFGVLLPFFMFNVFGNAQKHKKIFMGDTGTMTIGLIISILSIRILCADWAINPGTIFDFDENLVMVVCAPLIIPCFDVVRVYLGRVRDGRNPFLPDKTHIHHKLLAVGLKQRTAMMVIVSSSLVLSLILIALSAVVNVNILLAAAALAYILINIALTKAIKRRNAKLA